jgi:hypothetical protein
VYGGYTTASQTTSTPEDEIMKKLHVTLAFLVFMIAAAGIAAGSDTPAPGDGEKRFTLMDADKDGNVTREEYRAFKEQHRTGKLKEIFGYCDKNKDGALDFEEFVACKTEFKGKHGDRKHSGKKSERGLHRGQNRTHG